MPWLRNPSGRTPRQQQAYDLAALDYKTGEIAKIMGVSVKRVWSLLHIDKLHEYNAKPNLKEYRIKKQREDRARKRLLSGKD